MGSDWVLYNRTRNEYIDFGHKSMDFESEPLPYWKLVLRLGNEAKWLHSDDIEIDASYEMEDDAKCIPIEA